MLRFILFCLLTWTASEVIDPSRVQVITVLDVASPQITRDCLTLIRSLRLHGGSLNQATLTVYVPIANRIFYSDEYDIFPKLEALHVEIAFIDQAVGLMWIRWETLCWVYVVLCLRMIQE